MRIVVDTNAFVAAAFNPGSASARILAAARDGRLALVWDEATRAETRHVLSRIPRIRWEDAEPLFCEANRFAQETEPEAFGLVEDPADRTFAALAAAADAVLITSDHHLLDHADALPCRVETPGAFARRCAF